ncbi:MAG: glycosyltransferase family 2 protein [Candidatus Shapirobacteria bacterium]|nr:glycosyltransferase family 2 protein [Candidatus Shapirobacteria bacterium]
MSQIAIIVLNWKKPQLTIDTIDSLLKINHKSFSYKIFLVDNGSPDNSVEIFKNKYKSNKKIKLVETKKNLGYVGGNNAGIVFALKSGFDSYLLINNDVLVDPNFLEILNKASVKDKSIGILGPKIYFAPGHEFHKDRYTKKQIGKIIWSAGGAIDWKNVLGSNVGIDDYDQGQYDQETYDPDFISGCCMLIKKEVFQKIGLLNEDYFMYLEDMEICQRAKKNNYKLAYIPGSVIWHINAGSSSSGSPLHDYFITRNRLLFGFKYASFRTKFALFRESIKFYFFSKSAWKKTAVKDFYLNKLNKGSWQ